MSIPTLTGPELAPASGGKPKQIVLLTHGYGSNGQDLLGLAPYWQAALPDAVFLAPNAPERVWGAPNGYQWWPITGLDPRERRDGARRASPALNGYIDEQLARFGLAEDKLALVGFSQGTMIALHVAPRRPRPVAGVVGFSGMLADGDYAEGEMTSRPPILLIHGDMDPVLPVAAFHHAKAHFEGHGFDLKGHVSAGLAHSIDAAGVKLGEDFLKAVLKP